MLPRIPLGDKHNSTLNQAERMRGLSMARSEIEQIVATLRLKTPASRDAPVSLLDSEISPSTMVLVYCENSKIWEGPFELSRVCGKIAYVKTNNQSESPFAVTCVKPFYECNFGDSQINQERDVKASTTHFTRILSPKDVTQEVVQEFKQAIRDEMNGLLQKKAF